MKHASLWLALALALPTVTGVAQQTPDARPFSERHPTLTRRNIFDPERGRPRTVTTPPRTATPATAPPRRETVQLLGVALTEQDAFAHFSGADAPAVARVGDRIGALRLAEIRDGGVTLEADGERLELSVGRQLTRLGSGPWSVGAGDPSAVASAPAPPATGGSAPGTSPAAAEILRRMLERRQREMGP